MPATTSTYAFVALGKGGQRHQGRMRAPDEDAVRDELLGGGLRVVSIEAVASNTITSLMESIRHAREDGGPKVKTSDLAVTVKQLEVLLRAGMPPGTALEAVIDSCSSVKLQTVFEEVAGRVRQGESLSEALEHYPRTFSESFRAYVAAGETSGTLPETFASMYEQLEQQAFIESEIRSSTAYPRYAGAVALIIGLGMVQYLLPQFESIFAQFNSELPGITLLLIAIKDRMPLVVIGLLGVFGGIKMWLSSVRDNLEVGAKLDQFKYRLPVFGGLLTRQVRYRWTSTMAGLLRSGVYVDAALDIAARASGSRLLASHTDEVVGRLRQGYSLADSISVLPVLMRMEVALTATGEDSGTQDETLRAAADTIAQQVKTIVGTLGKRIEVLTLVLVMCGMGFIIAGLWLPLLTLSAAASEQF